MLDVFAFGQCAVDRLAVVDSFCPTDGKREAKNITVHCGGPPATAAVTLARWGRRVGFGGLVGDDDAGARIRADLAREGVDTHCLWTRPGASQYAFIAVEQGTGRRQIYWQRAAGGEPAPFDPPPARLFLTDGLYLRSAELARHYDTVVVDAGTLRPGTEALLSRAHVFVASESFAHAFAGDARRACERIRAAGPHVAGVTLGERGYLALAGEKWIEAPAHPAKVRDTTGCGDVFHAGLCEGILAGWPYERCFDFAAWAAARCAEDLGGRAGIPPREGYS